jgi:hypothetical protein
MTAVVVPAREEGEKRGDSAECHNSRTDPATFMTTPEEMAASSNQFEKEGWLLDHSRSPREILAFIQASPAAGHAYSLAQHALEVRISEIAEASSLRLERHTKQLVLLTYILAAFTLGVLIFTIALYVCHQSAHP